MNKWYDLECLQRSCIKYLSESGEDGLLKYIFDNIGTTSKYCVEFGAGKISNIPNTKLLRDSGWDGLMFEPKEKKNPPEIRAQYNIMKEIVSDENINLLFEKYNVPEDVDLVSIDIDGQDYYIWEKLEYKPRIIIIEFNIGLGPEKSIVMKRDLNHLKNRDRTIYYGASILAMSNLGKKLGYDLLCKVGKNLVFIKYGILPEKLDRNISIIHPIPIKEDFKQNDNLNREWVEKNEN